VGVVFLTLMILLAFFGSVEDATLFHLSYSQDDGNITTDVTPADGDADEPTNTKSAHKRSRSARRNGSGKNNMQLNMFFQENVCDNEAS
jgi:hypothetical protein